LNCCHFNPQKAHPWVIPSLFGVYALKSVNGFGQAAIPRKKRHTRSIFGHISLGNRLFDLEQIWLFGRAPVPYHTCQFLPRSIKNCCVALHESLPSFRFSALHRLSPLTQLGPAGPLVIISTMHTINTHTTSHFRLEASRKLLRCCGVDADFFRGIQ